MPTRAVVREGDDPAGEILKACGPLEIDLVAVAPQGPQETCRWSEGDMMPRILREARVPVVAFPPPLLRG